MTSEDKYDAHLHKEEMKARITSDAQDGAKIEDELQESVDALDPSTHPKDTIIQIVNGKIATDPGINVHEAVSIGQEMKCKI